MINKLFSKSVFLLLLTASLIGCDAGEPEAETIPEEDTTITQTEPEEDTTITQTEENVTTEDVAENADELIGQTVTIRSNALETIEPATFVVADQEFFGGEDIIVVNASGETVELPVDDTEVQITGEVTEFVLADIESAYDLDLDPDLYVDYTDRPAIIAQSIALAPEPGEIAADPTQYYGQTLAVTGEVENIYGNGIFTLDEEELFGGEDLLVVSLDSTQAVQDGETVATTGELRSFVVADIERDYDLTWEAGVREELEAEL